MAAGGRGCAREQEVGLDPKWLWQLWQNPFYGRGTHEAGSLTSPKTLSTAEDGQVATPRWLQYRYLREQKHVVLLLALGFGAMHYRYGMIGAAAHTKGC